MKNFKFLLGLFAVVLIMVSCAPTQRTMEDDYYYDNQRAQQAGNRIYMHDPYYGTIVLERDPYTGRYYDVTPGTGYGYGYGSPYGGYNRGNRVYSTPNRNYNGNNNVVKPQRPSREEIRRDRDATRRKVLGNGN